jgi:hypothetical protein
MSGKFCAASASFAPRPPPEGLRARFGPLFTLTKHFRLRRQGRN